MEGKSSQNVKEDNQFMPSNLVELLPLKPFEEIKPMYKKGIKAEEEKPSSFSYNN